MASPIVTMEAFGALPSLDGNGPALTPIVWLIRDLPAGDNPLDVFGVPKRGNVITLFGTAYTCDKVDTPQQINDNAFRVQTWFSTDGRWDVLTPPKLGDDERNFELGYKKVIISAPTFKKVIEKSIVPGTSTTVDRPKWEREDKEFPIEWRTLSINVVVTATTDQQILAIIAATELQEGHIHIFPYNPTKLWRMLTCQIKRRGDKVSIGYTWESDPGNGPIKIPNLDGVPDGDLIYPIVKRDPFTVYHVMSPVAADPDKKPRIWHVELFPAANNPYYTHNGWIGLPGNPI